MAFQSSTLRITVDSTGAQKNITKLDNSLGSLKGSAAGVTGILAGAATAAAGAGVAMTGFTSKIAENAKQLKIQSALANTSTQDFQRVAFAARTVGIEQDKLSDILKDVNDKVGDFISTGGGELKDFFEQVAPRVGVTADQFRNLSGPDALQLYVSTLEKANLSQAEMTFYMEAIANDGTALLPVFRDGGAAIEVMGDKAERLGLVLSDIDLAKLEDFSNTAIEVQGRLEAIGNQIGTALAPYITAMGDAFLGTAVDARSFGEVAEKAVFAVAAAVGVVADAVELVNRTFQLAGNAVAGFALGVQTAMLAAAESITSGPIERINTLIEIMNQVPGVSIELIDQPEFVKDLGAMRDAAYAAYAESTKDFEAILNAPMPSDNIEAWLAKVQAGMTETAEKVALARNELDKAGGSAKTLSTSNGGLTESQKILNQAMGEAARTFQSLRAEFDPVGVATDEYTAKQNQLKLLLDQGAISAENYRQAIILLSQQLRAGLAEGDMSGGFIGQVDTGGVASNQTSATSTAGEQDPMAQWLASAEAAFTDFDALAASTAKNFTTNFGSAFASAIQDSDSLGDAFASMASSMSTAILSALGEMAAEWLVYQAVQLATGATTQASAASTLTANAIATQQQAALAAYASTAAIPVVGPGLAPAAAATALATTAPYVTGVASAALSGMAHDGIDSVPNEGTWLLDRGERVVDSRTNEDLKTFLQSANSMQSSVSQSAGTGETTYYIDVQAPVTVQSSGDNDGGASAKKQGEMAGKALQSIILSTIQKQQKPGGILAGTGR